MPLTDVLPISTWRDLRTALVHNKSLNDSLDDEAIAKLLLDSPLPERQFKSAQSFKHLRAAIEFLFKNLELPNKRVIFPAYICDSVLRAAERAGLAVTLCDVDEKTGAMSYAALKRLPLDQCGAVFVVHPFGLGGEIEKIAELCREKKLFLIEDCAHVLGGASGRALGSYGDFVLFHFAKKLPNVSGSLLISASTPLPGLDAKSGLSISEFKNLLLRLKVLRPFVNLVRSVSTPPADHDEAHDADFFRMQPASRASKRLFLKQRKSYLANEEKRLEGQKHYLEFLPKNFSPLSEKPNPDLFHLPVLVPIEKNRDEILKKLRVYGVFADRLWYRAPCDFAQRILQLPLNEYMRAKDIRFICELLKHV